MKLLIPIFLFCAIAITSCGDKDKSASEELSKKVMVIHDEVMPKMGDIMKYKKQLNTKIDELTKAGQEQNADQIESLKKAVEDLDNSHDGMMNWMHQFNRNFESEVQDDVIAYFQDQMIKIEKVANTTNAALKNAEKLLAEQ